MVKFSFITVCYNVEAELRKTMESILLVDGDDYEYIVVDGASKDGTLDALKGYEKKFDGKMRWISEKDYGIYDAMNKGIANSRGQYITFINAGDVFLPECIDAFRGAIDADIMYGNTVNVYLADGKCKKVIKKSNPNITLKSLRRGMGVVHQSIFTHRGLFDKVGVFNVEYTIGADWDFLIRSVKNGAKLEYLDVSVCEFDLGGVSSGIHNMQRHKIRKANALYKVVDIEFFRDIFNLKVMLQLFIGKNNYQKLRYKMNQKRGN